MQVEQAVFTSTDRGQRKGYQLVSQSAGIQGRLAQELCQRAPSHGSLSGTEPDDWSLNYFSAGDGWVAIARTVYGGPEYSRRGGMQVVTSILALRVEQFAGYDNDALALAQTAMTLGHLRLLPASSLSPRLPTVDLPRRPIPWRPASEGLGFAAGPLAETLSLLRQNRRVAFVAAADPLAAVEYLIAHTSPSQRLDLSFATGLKPSVDRCFRLQFLPECDTRLRGKLESQGIASISSAAAS